jgi:ferric-dicitrate binding protein FerR (iron transport regulator)
MSSHNLDKEIRELSLKAADGQLDDDERARLNALIEADPQAAHVLLEYSMLDADLVFHSRAGAAEDRVLQTVVAEQAAVRRRSKTSRYAAYGLALAAAAAIAVAAWPRSRAPETPNAAEPQLVAERQPEPIATLSLAPGAVFAGDALAVNTIFLEGEELKIQEGEAHVSMACGAEFVLKAPGALQFISDKHVRLASGVLTAHVAKWGTGFTVDTDRMRVIDLGTQFAVSASDEDDETHVLQGQVRVQPVEAAVDGRRSVLLSEGEALRVDRGNTSATRIDAERDRFPQSTEDFRPFKPIAMFNTGVNLSAGDEDPHWRITAGPVGAAYHGPQFGVVCEPDVSYAPNEPERSQWISVAKVLRPGALPNEMFTYETSFDLTGFDLSTVTVAAQLLADNGVRAVRINGEPVQMKPWADNEFGQEFTRNRFRLIEIQRGFVPGENKLEIDVWNGIYQWEGMKADPNPMSLRVEFQAFGRLDERAAEAAARGSIGPQRTTNDLLTSPHPAILTTTN